MSKKTKTPIELGKRERQIYETVVGHGEATVAQVLAGLEQPPSYSAVRATMRLLVEKGWLKYREDGNRYIYSAAVGKTRAQRMAMKRMLTTFFGGSAKDAMVALLDVNGKKMTDDELTHIVDLIQQTRDENR